MTHFSIDSPWRNIPGNSRDSVVAVDDLAPVADTAATAGSPEHSAAVTLDQSNRSDYYFVDGPEHSTAANTFDQQQHSLIPPVALVLRKRRRRPFSILKKAIDVDERIVTAELRRMRNYSEANTMRRIQL